MTEPHRGGEMPVSATLARPGVSPARRDARAARAKRARRPPVDGTIATLVVLLLLAGLLTLFSATYYSAQDGGDAFSEVRKQLIGVGLGLAALLVTSRVPYAFWNQRWLVLTGLAASAALLLLVLIPGVGVYVNGSRRWLSVGGLSLQPSEVAKIACVLYLARALSSPSHRVDSLLLGVLPVLVVPGVMFLFIIRQPNLSTAGSILIVAAVMVVMAGARWRHLSLIGVCGAGVFAYYAWSEPYRRERLLSFRDPFAKMSDEGYQLAQSLIAFGTGGLFGMGLGQGRQKYAFLPYPESDFIFAIVGEDFGLFGCLAVIALFLAFLYAGMRVAMTCPDKFGSLLAGGITALICVQAFINMGVVVGILPTTGLPLPFFSSGGTSISILLAAVGMLLNVSRTCDANLR